MKKYIILILIFYVIISSQEQVGLYGVYEAAITNSKSYSNPFNYKEIELKTVFTAPSGKTINYFGFYAGNGNGGQNGNVWKLRCMPNETGNWTYTYSWTDGTSGGSGSFSVVDDGLPGPLQVASDNSWYFETMRGEPFDARPYDLHHLGPLTGSTDNWTQLSALYTSTIKNKMIDRKYNMAMVDSPSDPGFSRNWWWNGQKTVFDVAVWDDYEKILKYCLENKVYIFPFDGIVHQASISMINDQILRYIVARFGAMASYMGYSPTYEWVEVWSTSTVEGYMSKIHNWNPFPILLSVHDHSASSFTDWLGFSMRQNQSNSLFDGNCRTCGNYGGVDPPLDDKPIIGSEDIWETGTGHLGQPSNATEVRRAAWGMQMAGVLPLYSEWYKRSENPGNMPGEPHVRRMFDFYFSKTNYRQYTMLNNLVSSSSGQLCSGISGQEYLVYDYNGGSISINLSAVSSSKELPVTWFNPTNGNETSGNTITGGSTRTLSPPFSGDAVLLLGGIEPDDVLPNTPRNLSAIPSENSISLTWSAPSQASDGDIADKYVVKRNGTQIAITDNTQYTDSGLAPNTQYNYEVYARDDAGNISANAATVQKTTLADNVPPDLLSANALSESEVMLVFDEKLGSGVNNAGNYTISEGIQVLTATQQSEQNKIKLTVSTLPEDVSCQVTVISVQDLYENQANNLQASFVYFGILEITNLSPSNYFLSTLAAGKLVYLDRDYQIQNIPAELNGASFIQTRNDDKNNMENVFLIFTVNKTVVVYVGIAGGSALSWMADWTATGLSMEGSYGQVYTLYKKEFTAGNVALGGNEGSGGNMYTVVVTEAETSVKVKENKIINNNMFLSVSPNPVSKIADFRFQISDFNRNVNFKIYDLHGIVIKSFDKIKKNQISYDISNLPSGIYLIKLEVEDTRMGVGKQIISKRVMLMK